jgi:hypothetical protein
MEEVRWQDRALAAIRATERILPVTDRWSPSQPTGSTLRQAKLLLNFIGGYEAEPVIEPTIEGGLEFEWCNGTREMNVSVKPDGSMTLLQVEDDALFREGEFDFSEIENLFRWLAGK